jgi:hypothetical protein
MMNEHIARVQSEIDSITATAESSHDLPVMMLNLNRYTDAASYPDGYEYRTYMAAIDTSVGRVGGKVIWRTPVSGQPVGCEHDGVDEILAVWYPSHAAFLSLRTVAGSEEVYRLRKLCVANAVIHRCPGDRFPLQP